MYLAIVTVKNNRVAKFAEFEDLVQAQAHCDEFGGLVYEGAYRPDLYVDGQVVMIQQIVPSVQDQIDALKSQMAAIEAEQYMIRGAREAWLVLMENTAAGQSVTIEQLYAANPFYKKIKDADIEIAAMREQIDALEAQL